ncbi:MAG: EAL domain-containing protein [Bradyrhizobium sp.]|uniref:bifunctional diguanylate cyclase/phosphodiesterase n=1 Tax=Bradyrhizobium sp. TaxID=376 RepID=UPI0025B97F45|nr:EAL domain-containing protein [Bradyrhizobium sp.]MBI5260460.1 EAL domain-containing protein [Bradyrhizobium sp.]
MRGWISAIASTVSQAATSAREAASRRSPVFWLTACGGVLVTGILIGTIVIINGFRERALSNSERELENTVLLVTRHFDQQIEESETLAEDLISQMELSEMASAEEFRERMSRPEVYYALKSKAGPTSYLGNIAIYDANGDLINWSGPSPLPKISITDRVYYQRFKSDPHVEPVLTESALSHLSKKWTTIIARRLSGRDGVLLGVMTRRIEPESFERYFASVALPGATSISLQDHSGKLIARYPHAPELVGRPPRNIKDMPLLQQIIADGRRHTLRINSPIDHQDRLISGAPLGAVPIVVIATNTESAALADWREQTRSLVVIAVLSAAGVALILYLVIRQINRQNLEAQRRLEAERLRLDTALNNMTHGLIFYDASGRMVTCNRRYIDMYNLSADVVKPGCRFQDVMQHRKDRGSFNGNVEEFCSLVMKGVASGKPAQRVLESRDGRSFQVLNKPLGQGGWIATIEDITERRHLEQERDRNYAFLRNILDHIPSQISVKDVRDRRYLVVNRVAEEHWGRSRDAIIGKTPFEIFSKDSADVITDYDNRTLQSADGLFLDEHEWHFNGGRRYITSRRITIPDEVGDPRYIINVVDDVTERRRADEKIARLAHYDALTDLPNRVLFRQQIELELEKVRRGDKFAVLYIDVDEFKGINDSLGHHVGDELLKSVASRIRSCLNEGDLIARLGGDEFAVIRTGIESSQEVAAFVGRVQESIRQPYECLGHRLATDASIGVALAPQDGSDLDQLIKNADLAMYAAKAGGRRTCRFFEPGMDASAKARLAMEQDLRHALSNGGFEIHYQPLVDLHSNEVSCCEALLRWRHPERGAVSPAEFIPIAEDTGLIVELGEWVLRTACMEAASWPDHVRLAVNVSPVQLKCGSVALKIASALAGSGLDPRRLELEITEAVLIRDDEAALAILHQLRTIGVRIALDDFGTGYSSLSYLKRFPFDKIKIDRCFVADIAEPGGTPAIVQAVVNIATASNMTTVAEGVETEQQRELLKSLGCTEMQGYLFSAPRPAHEVKRLLGMAQDDDAAVA